METSDAPVLTLLPDDLDFLKKLITSYPDACFVVNGKKEIIFFNRKAEILTGFSAEEVLGKPCLVGIRCVNCLLECLLFKEGRVERRPLEFITASGEKLAISKNAETILNDDGEIIAGIESFRVLEGGIGEDQKNSISTIEQVLNSIGEGVVAVNDDQEISFANQQMETLIGYPIYDLMGKNIAEILDPALGENLADPALRAGTTTFLRHQDNSTVHVEMKSLALSDNAASLSGEILMFRPVTPSELVTKALMDGQSYRGVLSKSTTMINIFNLVESIRESDVAILLEGESGTGKNTIAQAIHDSSSRSSLQFKALNCAMYEEAMLESELFGHGRTAFNGAYGEKVGRIELVKGGSILLSEIDALPTRLQIKVLRFLQDGEFERIGEMKTRYSSARIMASCNGTLLDKVKDGSFRDDLYYRLNIIPLKIPSLKERIEDVLLLAEHFVHKHCDKPGNDAVFDDEAASLMQRYTWPGNVRELENSILHAVTRCDGSMIYAHDLPQSIRGIQPQQRPAQTTEAVTAPHPVTAVEMERNHILETLRSNSFNRSKTADILGITRTTLWRKMKKYDMI
jgi:PAS domain S-box-containing protein